MLENVAHFLDSQFLHWGNMFRIASSYVLVLILVRKRYGLFGTKNIERV